MFRLGIIEESIDNREILCGLNSYLILQRIENAVKDEYPIWHINEYHVPDDKIEGIADRMKQHMKGGAKLFGNNSFAHIIFYGIIYVKSKVRMNENILET